MMNHLSSWKSDWISHNALLLIFDLWSLAIIQKYVVALTCWMLNYMQPSNQQYFCTTWNWHRFNYMQLNVTLNNFLVMTVTFM